MKSPNWVDAVSGVGVGVVISGLLAVVYRETRPTSIVQASVVATGEASSDTLTDYVILQEKTGAGAHAALTAWIKAHTDWELACVIPVTEPSSMQHWPGTSGLLVVARRKR